jgi:hypothetical protein
MLTHAFRASNGEHTVLRKGASALDLKRFKRQSIGMAYVTIEVEIADGKLVPAEGTKLPERGRALVTLLPGAYRRTNWDAVEASLGVLRRPGLDSGAWQREVRAEWDRD